MINFFTTPITISTTIFGIVFIIGAIAVVFTTILYSSSLKRLHDALHSWAESSRSYSDTLNDYRKHLLKTSDSLSTVLDRLENGDK